VVDRCCIGACQRGDSDDLLRKNGGNKNAELRNSGDSERKNTGCIIMNGSRGIYISGEKSEPPASSISSDNFWASRKDMAYLGGTPCKLLVLFSGHHKG
jgi:hypothetical protein